MQACRVSAAWIIIYQKNEHEYVVFAYKKKISRRSHCLKEKSAPPRRSLSCWRPRTRLQGQIKSKHFSSAFLETSHSKWSTGILISFYLSRCDDDVVKLWYLILMVGEGTYLSVFSSFPIHDDDDDDDGNKGGLWTFWYWYYTDVVKHYLIIWCEIWWVVVVWNEKVLTLNTSNVTQHLRRSHQLDALSSILSTSAHHIWWWGSHTFRYMNNIGFVKSKLLVL